MEKLLVDLGGLCAAAGDHEEALTHFRRALELDAFQEGTCLAIMECEIRLGNRRAAMVEYERLKALLLKELDAEPLMETQMAMRKLMNGERANDESPGRLSKRAQPIAEQRDGPSAQVGLKGAERGLPR
jgi:DNA-binding SARP family transcriptional activator